VSNSLWQRIEEARSRWNVLEHSFYRRWSAGELTAEELAHYAGQYRHAVEAIAELSASAAAAAEGGARQGLERHADEERAHVALWDGFLEAAGGTAASEPAPETRECVQAWSRKDLAGALVTLYAIESGQPEISKTKREGLLLDGLAGPDEDELVAAAESAFRGNWRLLDGVERRFGRG
jgi:pyrroloquinoline-quinone synthase